MFICEVHFLSRIDAPQAQGMHAHPVHISSPARIVGSGSRGHPHCRKTPCGMQCRSRGCIVLAFVVRLEDLHARIVFDGNLGEALKQAD